MNQQYLFYCLIIFFISPAALQNTLTLQLYDGTSGTIQNGFENWSWAKVNYQDTTIVRPGSRYSLSEVITGYEALYFHGDFLFSVDDIDSLNFWINGGPDGAEPIGIKFLAGGAPVGSPVTIDKAIGTPIPANKWVSVSIPIADFAIPSGTYLDGLWFAANTGSFAGTVYFDDINVKLTIQPPKPVSILVDSTQNRHAFSKYIFGVNFASKQQLQEKKYTLNRWGGNAVTRYAWDIDVNNHASDWYFENIPNSVNVNILPFNTSSDLFIDDTLSSKASVLLTIPTIGWSPIDRQLRCGFSVQKYGAQKSVDPYHNDCGNGVLTNGANVKGNSPSDTSKQVDPSYQIGWIKHLDTAHGKGSVRWFQLDNEPGLWDSTHRDVHPNPLTYDELWNKTVSYATAIKQAFPDAKIFGPILWGYCAYKFSPADGCTDGPDRKAHGDLPLLEWYIQQIARYKFTNGVQLVDYIDVHFYPQAPGVGGSNEDLITSTLRLRAPRSLWDPTYVDESWISLPINLIPTIRSYINQYAPGLGIAISEHAWGSDNIITAAITLVEVLGVFAREGVDVAGKWTVPSSGSVSEDAYSLFLNYDGKGSQVSGFNVMANTSSLEEVSSFAFDDSSSRTLYVVLVSKVLSGSISVTVDVTKTSMTGQIQYYGFSKTSRLGPQGTGSLVGGRFTLDMNALTATLAVIKY
eukprot:TRINITY_DN6539_c0_g1_i2.p1 TRINITY_DN6539_c0_g1~~TRINITY_DN6539_c0_g1_i2.p1  ORF type:complete len:690 (-),score=137.16 TRINITY_DN6539_c0_g1_i2:26-2095(-)